MGKPENMRPGRDLHPGIHRKFMEKAESYIAEWERMWYDIQTEPKTEQTGAVLFVPASDS